jgi:hypothetical protein
VLLGPEELARHAIAPLGPVGADDARQHETREVVVRS